MHSQTSVAIPDHPTTTSGTGSNSSRLSKIVNEFAEETGVFSLSLLRRGVSRAEALFWIIATTFFVYCTARDLTSVTLAFLREDTLSLTTHVAGPAIVLDPAPALSFTHGFDKFHFQDLPTPGKLEKMVDDLLVAIRNSSDVDGVSMDAGLFELSATMLEAMSANEYALLMAESDPGVNDSISLEWASQYTRRDNFPLIQASVANVFARFRSANVSFSKLLKIVASHACTKLGFTVELPNDPSAGRRQTFTKACSPANIRAFDNVWLGCK